MSYFVLADGLEVLQKARPHRASPQKTGVVYFGLGMPWVPTRFVFFSVNCLRCAMVFLARIRVVCVCLMLVFCVFTSLRAIYDNDSHMIACFVYWCTTTILIELSHINVNLEPRPKTAPGVQNCAARTKKNKIIGARPWTVQFSVAKARNNGLMISYG